MSNLETSLIQDEHELHVEMPLFASPEGIARRTTAKLVGSPAGRPMQLCYFAGDVLAIAISILLGKLVASWLGGSWWQSYSLVELKLFGLFAVAMLVVAAWSGVYNSVPSRPARQFRSWTIGTFAVTSAIVLPLWLFDFTATLIFPAILVAALVTHLGACFVRAICRISFGSKDWWGTRVLVIGSGLAAREAIQHLASEPQWGLRPVGYLAEEESVGKSCFQTPCLGIIEDLDRVARQTGVQRALVALNPIELSRMRNQFYRSDAVIRHWIVIPSTDFYNVLWSTWNETARMPAVTFKNRLASRNARLIKRAFDLALAISAAIILGPLILGLWIVLRVTGDGPVFYNQRRIGRNGKIFYPWKFRTMVPDADLVLERYLEENPAIREEWEQYEKLKNDPRVTPIGQFLRATSLDELPQLWNVFKGEMSMVGPRPIVDAEAKRYNAVFDHYKNVVPGITGLWQVSGRNQTSSQERMKLDSYYVENWSVWLDVYVLACTVKVVLLREGAY